MRGTPPKSAGAQHPSFTATKGSSVGFFDPKPYAHEPWHQYQAWCRKGQGDEVTLHYTWSFSNIIVERTIWIPFIRGADHDMLPEKLRKKVTMSLSGEQRTCDGKGTFIRIDPDGHFYTTMTLMRPDIKNVPTIHPTQSRIMTPREAARAQGFPDHYQFCSVNKSDKDKLDDYYRQIGNAVPVHLARALALEFQETLIAHIKYESITSKDSLDDGNVSDSSSIEY